MYHAVEPLPYAGQLVVFVRWFVSKRFSHSFPILNGRFETADEPIPYTLQRQDEVTINDYNLIA